MDGTRRVRIARGGDSAPLIAGATGMNTTNLIAQWTMSGARRDADGRFRATDDIRAVIAGNHRVPEPAPRPEPEPPALASSFLIKGAGEDGWRSFEEEEPHAA